MKATAAPKVPHLKLPLKVGIAFVPEETKRAGLSEAQKIKLIENVSSEFKKQPFVGSLEVIPTSYLKHEGGFTNLGQVQRLFNLDIIVLLAYDQIQHTDEGLLSLTYWTIVGAYIFKGEKNDTSTMIEAAVYHPESRTLLFRAPGTSRVKGRATPINLTEQLRKDSLEGFNLAANDMALRLTSEMHKFQAKVKAQPQTVKVTHKAGNTGGGSLDLFLLILSLPIAGLWLWSQEKKKQAII